MCDNSPGDPCHLCGLEVGKQPFLLDHGGQRLQFCCEGCLGIWQMLHEDAPPAPPPNPGDETP
jgi:hypothetical protein